MIYTVDYHGRSVRLSELAKLTGVSLGTLQSRHEKGDRGERLWRPLERTRRLGPTSQQYDMVDGKRIEASKREQDRRRQTLRQDRNRLRAERLAAVRAEHAEALKRPLIAKELLSKWEREAIHESVQGRQRWWTADSAYLVTG